jgi:hypothetical protein
MAEKEKPTCWTFGWSMDIELGFADGKYLPRKAALILYPEYFDEQGEPIRDMLPFGYAMTKKPRGYGKKVFEERVMAYRRTQDVRKNNN